MTGESGIEVLRRMLYIRYFEETLTLLAEDFSGQRHVAIGQEAGAVAVGMLRRPNDKVLSTHRNHGHNLAMGVEPNRLMAEIYGRIDGTNHGKAGSFHASDPDHGVVCASAIVGSGIALACGLAHAAKMRGQGDVAICFFGNGAVNEGVFYESLNLACLWHLPVVLICENNNDDWRGGASDLAFEEITELCRVYPILGKTVDGADYLAVQEALETAMSYTRNDGGPSLIEIRNRPWPGGRGSWPPSRSYTPLIGAPLDEEDAAWEPHDVLRRWSRELVERHWADAEKLQVVAEKVRLTMAAAVAFARNSPPPTSAEALTDVLAEVERTSQ